MAYLHPTALSETSSATIPLTPSAPTRARMRVGASRFCMAKDASPRTEIGGNVIKPRAWLVYLFGLPADLIATLVALLLAPFQTGLGLRFEHKPDGPGLWALTVDVDRLFGSIVAITIAPHVIIYKTGCHFPQGWSMLQEHEHAFGKRYEGAGLTGFMLALCGFVFGAPWHVALATWIATPWLYMVAGNIVAWLRGETYSGSSNEEAAYAIAAQNSKR
jgi:hypothetical protein